MKKKLLTFVLAMVLCFSLAAPASAVFVTFEDSAQFGAWTWQSVTFYPAEGMDVSKQKDEFEKATGLIVFSEEIIDTSTSFRIPYTYYGLKDSAGNVVLPMDFVSLVYLDDGNILVKRKREDGKFYPDDMGGYGIYTTSGKAVVAASYDNFDIDYAEKDIGNYLITKRTGYVSQSQDPVQTQIENQFLGYATGLYDRNGKELLPTKYGIIDYMEKDGYYRIQECHRDSDSSVY